MATFRRKTWLRILIVAALGLATVCGLYLFTRLTTNQEEIAEADRLDPGWRWEELVAKMPTVPDERNSALRLLAAIHQELPQATPQHRSARIPGDDRCFAFRILLPEGDVQQLFLPCCYLTRPGSWSQRRLRTVPASWSYDR